MSDDAGSRRVGRTDAQNGPPIRVAFVLPSFAGGGAQKVLLSFAVHLNRKLFAPVVIVLEEGGPWQALVPDDLRVISLARPRLRNALPELVRVLRAVRPGIIVSTIGYLNLGILLVKPLLSGRQRIIVREANTPRRNAQSALGQLGYRLAYRWLYRRADRVLCPASYLRDELIADCGLSAERILVLSNPLDEDMLRAFAGPPQRAPGSGRRFVCIGRLTEQKGYDRLLDDWAHMPPDTHLTIFGEGEQQTALQAQIERLGLKGRVALAGFEPQPAPWLAGADALLLPSRWEGLPNVALEALACGTPVIATPEAGGISEIAAQAKPGAVVLAPSGGTFVRAMLDVVPRQQTGLRPSLLPDGYRLAGAVAAFSSILAA
jgi:glycosyltransferase involved in cell wall biosynthesis